MLSRNSESCGAETSIRSRRIADCTLSLAICRGLPWRGPGVFRKKLNMSGRFAVDAHEGADLVHDGRRLFLYRVNHR